MNQLDPQLKRLLNWARQAPQVQLAPKPEGFAQQVVARSRLENTVPSSVLALWQNAIRGSAWAAAVIILVALLVLTLEKLRSNSPYDFSPAYQAVITEFIP